MVRGLGTTLVAALLAGGCSTPSAPPEPSQRFSPAPTTAPIAWSIAPKDAAPSAGESIAEIGHSLDGRPMTLHTFGSAAHPTLIIGGIHGNEPTAAGVCRELAHFLKEHPESWAGRCVAILPEANPDGLARHLRTNSNLIDLNRNFPATNWAKTRRSSFFGGDAPATEPETVALIDLLERLQPARIISVHSMAAPCNNFDGPADALARLMSQTNHYPVRSNIGYATPGSLGSWAGVDRHIPIITLELPLHQSTTSSWEENRDALVAAIQADAVAAR